MFTKCNTKMISCFEKDGKLLTRCIPKDLYVQMVIKKGSNVLTVANRILK